MDESPKLFRDDLADRLKSRARQAYRPSNGTEGEMFMERWCERCAKEEHCDIPGLAMLFDVDELEYPDEWQYGTDGQPRCSAFEAIRPATP